MNAQLRQYEFAGSADNAADDAQAAAEAARTELMADGDRLAELELSAAENMLAPDIAELRMVMADMSDAGAVKRWASGDRAHDLNALQLDTFARFARLADRMAAERHAAIEQELAA